MTPGAARWHHSLRSSSERYMLLRPTPSSSCLEDSYDQWADLYGRISENLFPFMPLESQRAVAQYFERYLEEPGNFTYRPVLRHGDFGPSNILFDQATCAISGALGLDVLME
jgi:hypothetical protein